MICGFIIISSIILSAIPSGKVSDVINDGDYIISVEDLNDISSNPLSAAKGADIKDMEEDEILKNKLLYSDKTNYSEPAAKTPLNIRFHKVKSGESLCAIAKKYGISMATISGSNNLNTNDNIAPGTALMIPNREGILHKMKSGNNIAGLASKYKIPVEKILAENNLKNPDFVPENEVIFIPDAKPQNTVSGFLWPANIRKVTNGYGWRKNPFTGKNKEFHKGMDIGVRYGWVRSTKYGKVTFAGWMGGYGNAVIIAHPGGWKSLYGHLSKIIVSEGQYVNQGQNIAVSGNSGRSTGPHVHFELIKQGDHTNPKKYL
jgi:murein DD-endopeptidase MepM/ murein hydrolase activator NlpD